MTEITARGNRLRVTKRNNLIGGSVGVNPFRVICDAAWKDYYVSAVFTCNGVTKRVQVFEPGEEHQIPWEILAKENIGNTVAVGLYGVGKDDPAVVMQSEPVALDILADGTDPIEPANPTPNEFSYALKRANEAVDQTLTALAEANSARDTAVAAQNVAEKKCAAVNEKAVEIEGYKAAAENSAEAASGFASIARAHEESALGSAEAADASAAAAAYWAEQAEMSAGGELFATKEYADNAAQTAEDHAKAYAVPTTRKVNGKELAGDITLSAGDVGARADDWLPTCADLGTLKQSLHSTETTPEENHVICWQYQ